MHGLHWILIQLCNSSKFMPNMFAPASTFTAGSKQAH